MSHLNGLLRSALNLSRQCTHLYGRDIWAWRSTVIKVNFLWHFIKSAYVTVKNYWWKEI